MTPSSSSLAQQPLSVKACLYPLVKWAWLSVTYCYHSRIVSPTYDGAVYSGFEPMTGMLLRRTSWRLYHQTGPWPLKRPKTKTKPILFLTSHVITSHYQYITCSDSWSAYDVLPVLKLISEPISVQQPILHWSHWSKNWSCTHTGPGTDHEPILALKPIMNQYQSLNLS